MAEEQPTFKVVDRRPFNPDGTPRELSAEEKEAQHAAEAKEAPAEARPQTTTEAKTSVKTEPPAPPPSKESHPEREQTRAERDPLDDPASFVSLISCCRNRRLS